MVATEKDRAIIKKEVHKSFEKGLFRGKKVIVFGCTIYARNVVDALREYGIPVNAFIDNNKEKAGGNCLGVRVYTPEEILLPYDLGVVVIICSKYDHEMRGQLIQMGYPVECFLHIPITENASIEDDSPETLGTEYSRVSNGYRLYRGICEKYGEGILVCACLYPGTGDVYMACSYLPEYLHRKKIHEYVLLVVGNSCVNTAKLFSIPIIEQLAKEDMRDIVKAWEFLGSKWMNLKPLAHWGWRTKRFLYTDKYPQITFTELFLYDVYSFEQPVERRLPVRNETSDYARLLFERLSLPKGKTIILAPYAGSFEASITTAMWARIANRLKIKGYALCTNCFGEKEVPIPGTWPICFPHKEAVNVLEYAGGFVAIRSGLCDIVSTAKCKMIILYEKGFNATNYEYFSLKKMGLNTDVTEIIYQDEGVVDTIISEWEDINEESKT